MEPLILIGVVLLLSVLSIDCVVRLVIEWNIRKQKRTVKPLGFIDANANNNNNNNNNNGTEEGSTVGEDIENQDGAAA